tara:strand:- start:258 stop:1196 length:939 start_codon:yes stop_codon:yes gene_type:complete
MLSKSIEQLNLYSMDEYINDLIHLYENKKLPNKIILSGETGIGKSVLAFHLINYIFSKNEDYAYDKNNFRINESNKSFNLVKNNSHPNFYFSYIDEDKKSISVNEIRDIISFCNKSSFNNCEKIVLIDNIEHLNKNASNALLKILEEPNEKVIFILIKDSAKFLLKTIDSRCINFNVNLSYMQKEFILNNILENDFYVNLNEDFKNFYFSPGDFVNLYYLFVNNNIEYQFTIEQLLDYIIKNKLYKKDSFLKNNMNLFFELYFSKKFFMYKNNISAFDNYKVFIKEVNEIYKYNLDLESVLIRFEKIAINEK